MTTRHDGHGDDGDHGGGGEEHGGDGEHGGGDGEGEHGGDGGVGVGYYPCKDKARGDSGKDQARSENACIQSAGCNRTGDR
jgi:hypothetical protein